MPQTGRASTQLVILSAKSPIGEENRPVSASGAPDFTRRAYLALQRAFAEGPPAQSRRALSRPDLTFTGAVIPTPAVSSHLHGLAGHRLFLKPLLHILKEPQVSMPAAAVIVSHIHRNIDAVTLLKADHRYIEEMFLEFERTDTPVQKQQLAAQICTALMVHQDIEQEIFYPAFLAETQHRGLHHEAIVEHDEAENLITNIMDMSAEDEFSEMIAHHVREEERIGGMFSTARTSTMDLMSLGQAMQQRRSELLGTGPMLR